MDLDAGDEVHHELLSLYCETVEAVDDGAIAWSPRPKECTLPASPLRFDIVRTGAGSPASVDATSETLDAQSMKKIKRNARDRVRMLMKRDSIDRMRQLVRELEAKKQALMDQQRSSLATNTARQEYLDIVQQIELLHVENNALYDQIRERDLFRNMIQILKLEFRTAEDIITPTPFPLLEFDEAKECVAKAQQQVISAYHENLRRRSVSTARIFGWSDFRCKSGTSISFAVRRTFVHSSLEDLAERTWQVLSSDVTMHTIVPTPLECEFTVRQVISDDAVVIDRRTRDPRVPDRRVVRTAYLSVRGRDETGGRFVAMKTLDDPRMQLVLSDSELWCDIFYWFYFTKATGKYGEECTTVEFGGSSCYMSEDIARYWVAELVFVAIRWETAVVAPVFITAT
ncbi:hypothetical protein P43SY_009946 [Pythium insidiosum]|uniref:Uncharacterized protein n=1 Tax=Pythium insidiosum TaxID=114742 RepID=A0AAD5M8Q2_PYTIN|nr:hypothetical protein P43SY_009946 [Pythium insidiosum]